MSNAVNEPLTTTMRDFLFQFLKWKEGNKQKVIRDKQTPLQNPQETTEEAEEEGEGITRGVTMHQFTV